MLPSGAHQGLCIPHPPSPILPVISAMAIVPMRAPVASSTLTGRGGRTRTTPFFDAVDGVMLLSVAGSWCLEEEEACRVTGKRSLERSCMLFCRSSKLVPRAPLPGSVLTRNISLMELEVLDVTTPMGIMGICGMNILILYMIECSRLNSSKSRAT